VVSARALPGSMAPVMSMLFVAQTDIMTLSAGDLKETLKRFDKAPDVSRMGMFTNIGASRWVFEDVTTMVEYCTPVHKIWRVKWRSPNAFRRLHWRSAAWKPAPRNFSNCASASNWPVIGSLELQPQRAPPERYTPCCSHTARPEGTKP